MKNDAPCLTSDDQVVLNPKLVLSNGTLAVGSYLRVYPNPVNGQLNIETDASWTPSELRIYDMTGRLLISESWKGELVQRIDLNKLVTGVYLLEVNDENGNSSVRKVSKH